MNRIFLLSPARTTGKRAELVLNPQAEFPLARKLHRRQSVALGEVFTFLSGLYFRGKLIYATMFARPPAGLPGVLVITPNRGSVDVGSRITLSGLRSFSQVEVDCAE